LQFGNPSMDCFSRVFFNTLLKIVFFLISMLRFYFDPSLTSEKMPRF